MLLLNALSAIGGALITGYQATYPFIDPTLYLNGIRRWLGR